MKIIVNNHSSINNNSSTLRDSDRADSKLAFVFNLISDLILSLSVLVLCAYMCILVTEPSAQKEGIYLYQNSMTNWPQGEPQCERF